MFSRSLLTALLMLVVAIIAVELDADSGAVGASHEPILIVDDSGFNSTNGVVSGNGSDADPYVISDWEIAITDSAGLLIRDTHKAFIIQNVTISGSAPYPKHSLQIVRAYGTVLLSNITIKDAYYYAVMISRAYHMTVKGLITSPGRYVYVGGSTGIDLRNIEAGTIVLNDLKDSRLVDSVIVGTYDIGIDCRDSRNLTLLNCTSSGHTYGAEVDDCPLTLFEGCRFSNNWKLDMMLRGGDAILRNNTFEKRGIFVYGFHDIDDSNTVNNLPLRYRKNETGVWLDSPSGQVILLNCSDVYFANMTMVGPFHSVYMDDVINGTFENLTLSSYSTAMNVREGENITVRNCTITTEDNEEGIASVEFAYTVDVSIEGCHIKNGTLYGIYITGAPSRGRPTSLRFVNTIVSDSYIAGVRINRLPEEGELVVIDCWFHDSSDSGIILGTAYRVDHGNVTVENTTFSNMGDLGIQVIGDINVSIRNCTFNTMTEAIVLDARGEATGRVIVDSNRIVRASGITSEFPASVISNNTITSFQTGIILWGKGSICENNNLTDGTLGIELRTIDLRITNNIIDDCTWRGIYASYRYTVWHHIIQNCTITDSQYGIHIDASANGSLIDNCTIRGGIMGIVLERTTDYTITWNTITDCRSYGLRINSGGGHNIHHNTFEKNEYDDITSTYRGHQASSSAKDQFDDGSEGNYWADYTQWYPNAVANGRIWDTPYSIHGDNTEDRYPLTVRPDAIPPIADAGEDQEVPQDTTVMFNGSGSWDNIGLIPLEWSFTYGGNPQTVRGMYATFMFSIPGVYNVTLTVRDAWGFSDTDTVSITVLDTQAPVADAGPDITVDMGEEAHLSAKLSWDNVGIVGFLWVVDPGGLNLQLTGPTANLTFDDPGDYLATLSVIDIAGNVGNDTIIIHAIDIIPPMASAGEDMDVDQGAVVTFDASGSTDNVGIEGWEWRFQYELVNETLEGQVVTFTFGTAGTYMITLEVTDAYGLTDMDHLTVVVRDTMAPFILIGPDRTVNEGETLVLDGSESTDNVGIASYNWTFEHDGSLVVLEGAKTEFTFTQPGVHIVTLEVVDLSGNSGTATLNVTVRDITPPVAAAGEDKEVDQYETISLDGSHSHDNVGIIEFHWTFQYMGEDIELEGEEVVVAFDEAGSYDVTLTVIDAAGHQELDRVTVRVLDITPPVPQVGDDLSVDQGRNVVLDGSASTDNVGVTTWSWTFRYLDEDHELTGKVVQFTFDEPSQVEVTLHVADEAGNVATTLIYVSVNDIIPPIAQAGEDLTIPLGKVVTLDGGDSTDNMEVIGWTWTFDHKGTPVVIEGQTVDFTFQEPGVYDVTLTVRDASGHEDADTLQVKVKKRAQDDDIGGSMLILAIIVIVAVVIAVGYWQWKGKDSL